MKKIKTLLIFLFVIFSFLGCSFKPKEKVQLSQPTINTCKAKSPSKVYLSWSYVPNAEFYGVYYYDLTANNGTRYLAKGHITWTSCTVDDLEPNTNYGFTIIAKANGFKDSIMADVREVITPSGP